MRTIDGVEPAWNEDGWGDFVLGVWLASDRVRRWVETLPDPTPAFAPDDDVGLDLLLGIVHVCARVHELVRVATLDGEPEPVADRAEPPVSLEGILR